MSERKPCRECREPISVEANRCPHCGHIGVANKTILVSGVTIAVGVFLSVSIIGAIIGVPMTLAGMLWLMKRAHESTPADTSAVES